MLCFEQLKIEMTKDTKAIRQAYSDLLPLFSPEKDPEGFQRLRESYENAMTYAKSPAEVETSEKLSEGGGKHNERVSDHDVGGSDHDVGGRGPSVPTEATTVDGFMMGIDGLYQDFPRRIDPTQWRDMLAQGICHHIDTASEVEARLLDFLMANYRMPQHVWKELDAVFLWTDNREALLAKLPEGFVNHLLDSIREIHTIEYPEIAVLGTGAQAFLDNLLAAEDAFEKSSYHRCQRLLEGLRTQLPEQTNVGVLSARCLGALGHLTLAMEQFDHMAQINPSNLDVFFYRGELNYRLGRMALAACDYQRALEIKPSSQGSRYHLGKAYMSLGSFKAAVDAFEVLVKYFPGNQDVESLLMCNRCFYLEQLEGEIAKEPSFDKEMVILDLLFLTNQLGVCEERIHAYRREGVAHQTIDFIESVVRANDLAYADAQKNLEILLSQNPQDGRAWFRQAEYHHNQEAFEEAIVAYEHALMYHESDPILFNNYSHALVKVGRFDEALKCCNQGIGLFPNAMFILKNRALAWYGLEAYDKAVIDAQKVLQYLPSLDGAYDVCFQALMAQGLYSEVHKLYQKAMEQQVHCVDFALHKANAFRFENQFNEAISGFEYILDQAPGHPEATLSLARCHYMLEAYQEAVATLLAYLETEPKAADEFYDLLGDSYARLEQPKLAVEAYKRASEINPNEWRYFYGYGHTLSDLEDYKGAIEVLKKALAIDAEALDPLINMSFCHYRLGDYRETITICDRALAIDAQLENALRNKAWSLYMLGDLQLAHQFCDQFLQLDPNQEAMLSLKVRLYQKQQLKREARAVVDQWLAKNPTSEKAKALKIELDGTVLTRMKQFINTI